MTLPIRRGPAAPRRLARPLLLLVSLLSAVPAMAADTGAAMAAAHAATEPPSRSAAPLEHLTGPRTVTTVQGGGQADAAGDGSGRRAQPASTVRSGEAITQLRRFAASTQAASGRFVQMPVGGRQAGTTRGQFAFSRPGNFRWEIESPDQQLIVTDGKKLHFYDKELRQVTVRAAGEAIQATPAAVLFGFGDLNDSFRLSELGVHGGVAWVEAVPKRADSGFDRIRVGLRNGQPVAMEVSDAFGQVNRYQFSELKTGVKLPEKLFRFVPPAGVDVLE